ncbi:Uma2 family endonuclease [Pyxidicoccus sp. 3LFB2]
MPLSPLPEMEFLVPRRFTVAEYQRLLDVGVLHEDEAVELREGIIAEKCPSGPEPGHVVPRRFTPEEYHRLIDVGVLDEDDPVELLEGVIVEMTPHGKPHAWVVSILGECLMDARRADCRVRIQLPLSLADSEPEPDIAVVLREDERTATVHPRTALLVVEVANESIQRDRTAKGRLYAQAQVPEYWVVDVAWKAVEVYTEPEADGGYRAKRRFGLGEVLSSPALPGLSLPVASLFT